MVKGLVRGLAAVCQPRSIVYLWAVAIANLARRIARESFSAWGLFGYDDQRSIDARAIDRKDLGRSDSFDTAATRPCVASVKKIPKRRRFRGLLVA